MDFIVKELETSDIDNGGLFETLDNLRSVDGLSISGAKEILNKMNSQDIHIFVAIDSENSDMNKGIIGTASVMIEQKLIHGGARVAHIEDVSTRKGFEGNGIAKRILDEIESYAKKRDCYKIILDCSEENTGFYAKRRYRRNEIHMRLDL